jgi:undecaprenyl-diphosphatase
VLFVGLAHVGAAVALRHSPIALVQLALGALGGGAADVALKRHFERPRPRVIPQLAYVTSWSYPSGHSIASSSLYLTLAFAATRHAPSSHRAMAVGAAGTLAACVGATRVYLGVHHPSDVIAGLAIGTAWACLLEAVFESRGAYRVEAAVAEAPEVESAALDALAEEGVLEVQAERRTELALE